MDTAWIKRTETEELLAKVRSLEERLKTTQERLAAAEERRATETELQCRSRMSEVVLSNLPDLICTFDVNGCFTYANTALLVVWQKTLEAIIGKNTHDLGYPPELAARIQNEVRNVVATQQPVKNLTAFTSARGEERIYEYIFSPVLGGDRWVQEVTCTARDVTDRENMTQADASIQRRLEQLLAQALVAIVVLRGPDLIIRWRILSTIS